MSKSHQSSCFLHQLLLKSVTESAVRLVPSNSWFFSWKLTGLLRAQGRFLHFANRWKTLSAAPDIISDWQGMKSVQLGEFSHTCYGSIWKGSSCGSEKYTLSRIMFIGNLSEIFYFYPRDQKLQKCTLHWNAKELGTNCTCMF